MKQNGGTRAIRATAAALLSVVLLAACGTDDPVDTEATPTTGVEEAFNIEGTVRQVELSWEDDSPDILPEEPRDTGTPGVPTPGDDADDAEDATPSPTPGERFVLLAVQVDSIDNLTADMCDVSEGDSVTLRVDEQSAITPTQDLEDLAELEGRTVRAEGQAEELADDDNGRGAQQSPTPGATPATPGATPATPGATPTNGDDENGENGIQVPDVITDVFDFDENCHFDVAILTVVPEDDGTTPGTGETTPGTGGGAGTTTGDRETPATGPQTTPGTGGVETTPGE